MNNFATKVNKVIPNLLKVNLRKASMQAVSSTSTASQGKGPLVAVAQLTATNDHAKNFSEAAQCAQQAADKGCSLLALPECFSFIGSSPQETLAQVGGVRPLFFLDEPTTTTTTTTTFKNTGRTAIRASHPTV
jgi:hypothetical protein